jgi:hypothetical protein
MNMLGLSMMVEGKHLSKQQQQQQRAKLSVVSYKDYHVLSYLFQ